jgi:hypothetical protein
MNRIILAVLIVTVLITPAFCQEEDTLDIAGDALRITQMDSLRGSPEGDSITQYRSSLMVQADSLVLAEPDFSHSPSKAIMFALVLPGLGQAYNKKYYKMPIVWAALGGAGYAISYNTKNYRQASQDYALTPDDENEHYLQFWRRNMELSYIALIFVYALQVVDAYVDAQLYSWDVNDNLSLRVAPSLQPLMSPNSITGQAYGLTCSFDLKRKGKE